MKNLIKSILKTHKSLFAGVFSLSLVLTSSFGIVDVALASTPSLSVVNNSSNMVQVTVTNADSNSTVNLYYNYSSSSNVYVANLGTTNSSGYFSTNLNQNSYSIPQNAYVYMIVNGQTSNQVMWPNNVNNSGSVTLSQSSLTLGYNQSGSVNIYGGNGGYYISTNSNSSLVTATVSGSTLNVTTYSNNSGNATLTVCSYNNNGCATLYVYVQSNSNYNQPTYLSQSNISINVGQGQSITINGSGSYNISSNSNPSAISALVSGSVLNVYGSASGSGTLNICSTSGNGGCATLYVTVGGYYNYNGYTGYNNNNYYNGYNNNYTGYTTYTNGTSYNGYPYGYTYNNNAYTYSNQGRVLGASTDSSSVYLSQVPSTGISLNLKVILFLIGLLSWSLFASYIFMAKQKRGMVR